MIFEKILCTHNYLLINQLEIKSQFDIVVENGYCPKTYISRKRKYITDYKCNKCNKLKRIVEITN